MNDFIDTDGMTHKERMQELRKTDPIHYYELTDNPTGSNDVSVVGWVIVVIMLALFFIIVFGAFPAFMN